jgi:type IX secretion system PorP/SprF family membrane protein
MKKYLLIIGLLLLALHGRAQQKALYSQYMTNYFLLNPAVAGFDKDWKFKAGFRNQWVGFEGAPKTTYLSGESALFKNQRKRRRRGPQSYHGAGGYLYTDKTGPTNRSGLLLSYAYHLPLSKTVFLSTGLFAGVQQFAFDPNKIQLANNSNDQDPASRQGNLNALLPDLSIGTYLHANKFYTGVSLFQVLGNKIFSFENSHSPSRLYRHLFVSAGFDADLSKNITLSPSVLVKYVDPAPWQADFNVKGTYHFSKRRRTAYDDKIWAGLSYRTQDAVVAIFGFHFLKQYELSYAYDITTSEVRHYSSGSHEIVFGLRVK